MMWPIVLVSMLLAGASADEQGCQGAGCRTSGQSLLQRKHGVEKLAAAHKFSEEQEDGAGWDRIKSLYSDSKCMDYDVGGGSGNVYMYSCHTGNNQIWHLEDGGALKTAQDDKCLDYNYNTLNVYMYDCHGGNNQKWYFEDGALKSRHDAKCLDLHMENANVYMHDCHGGNNQKFYFEGEGPAPAAVPAPAPAAVPAPAPAAVCENSDEGHTDKYDYDCSTSYEHCLDGADYSHDYDDDDFTAADMCCSCKVADDHSQGGRRALTQESP